MSIWKVRNSKNYILW